MNRLNLILLVALAAFIAGIGVGCTVGFDVEQTDKFPCQNDDDCVSGFDCGPNNLCRSVSGPTNIGSCVDIDGDGYGVGEPQQLQTCAACTEARENGCVQSDCDDSNDQVNPGSGEVCDGVDNDCDMEIDEPTMCGDVSDCPNEGADYQPSCSNGTCEYKPFLQIGAECQMPLECTGGVREPIPAACQ